MIAPQLSDEEIINNYPPTDSDYDTMASIMERRPDGHIRIPKGFSMVKGDASQLATSKHYVDTAVATRAPKLEHPGDGQTHVYSINGNDIVQPIKVGTNTATENTIVKRTSTGTVRTANPIDNLDATNKKYVDDAITTIQGDVNNTNSAINTINNKLDTKLTRKTLAEGDTNRYVYTQSYKQTSDGIELMQIGQNTSPANSIVRRTSSGTIRTNTPSVDNDAATKKYVDTSIADFVDSAPEALNTLNELAKALGNDPNFAATILEQLSTKLSIDHNTALDAHANLGWLTITDKELSSRDLSSKKIEVADSNLIINNAEVNGTNLTLENAKVSGTNLIM